MKFTNFFKGELSKTRKLVDGGRYFVRYLLYKGDNLIDNISADFESYKKGEITKKMREITEGVDVDFVGINVYKAKEVEEL